MNWSPREEQAFRGERKQQHDTPASVGQHVQQGMRNGGSCPDKTELRGRSRGSSRNHRRQARSKKNQSEERMRNSAMAQSALVREIAIPQHVNVGDHS